MVREYCLIVIFLLFWIAPLVFITVYGALLGLITLVYILLIEVKHINIVGLYEDGNSFFLSLEEAFINLVDCI